MDVFTIKSVLPDDGLGFGMAPTGFGFSSPEKTMSRPEMVGQSFVKQKSDASQAQYSNVSSRIMVRLLLLFYLLIYLVMFYFIHSV